MHTPGYPRRSGAGPERENVPAGGRAEAATEHTRMPRTAERRVTALLLMMTALTGLVDSMTFLGLGEVFVANMTGNVAVLGFSLAGASGISGVLSLDALACFVFGALVGGRISARFDDHSRLWLGAVTAVQALLLSGALLLTMFALHDDLRAAVAAGGRLIDTQPSQADYALVSMLAVGMGLQHATAQRLARPEIPTNVLTTTITTFVIQTRLGGGHGSRGLRQLVGPALLLTSAAVGALGFLKVAVLFPLICGLALTLASLALATVGSAPAPAGSRQRAPAGVTPPSRPE